MFYLRLKKAYTVLITAGCMLKTKIDLMAEVAKYFLIYVFCMCTNVLNDVSAYTPIKLCWKSYNALSAV